MSIELRVEGAGQLHAISGAMSALGAEGKLLERSLNAGIRQAVQPLVSAVHAQAPVYLPGRYAGELSGSLKVGIRKPSKGAGLRLRGAAKTSKGKPRDLNSLNRGRLRHPLYGNRRHWFDQTVRPGWWDKPLQAHADQVRADIVAVMNRIAATIEDPAALAALRNTAAASARAKFAAKLRREVMAEERRAAASSRRFGDEG